MVAKKTTKAAPKKQAAKLAAKPTAKPTEKPVAKPAASPVSPRAVSPTSKAAAAEPVKDLETERTVEGAYVRPSEPAEATDVPVGRFPAEDTPEPGSGFTPAPGRFPAE